MPAARLYLDDIERIIQIFVEAEKERSEELRIPGRHEPAEVFSQVQDQTTIQDLARIHPDFTNDFYVEVRKSVGFNGHVRITSSNTTWYDYGLTDNEEWGMFHKLEALLGARKLSWKSLLHARARLIRDTGQLAALTVRLSARQRL